MLLTIDVGNTNITMGVFDGQDLLGNFRVTTKINRTSDEFGIVIKEILRSNDLDANKIDDVIIASVVPNVMHSLTSSIIKYFDIQPIIVEAGIKTGIRIATENPKQMPAYEVIKMATINGAKALRMEDKIGSIAEGKKADIIILNLDTPVVSPINDIFAAIVYNAKGSNVETTIINGKILK